MSESKMQPKARRRGQPLRADAPQVVAMLAMREPITEIARLYEVAESSVFRFQETHADAIAAIQAEVEAEVADVTISVKANRIRELDALYREVDQWQDAHGLTEETRRYDKEGNVIGETTRFRADLVNAKRGILRDVAEELGQLPKAETNIFTGPTVIVREREAVGGRIARLG